MKWDLNREKQRVWHLFLDKIIPIKGYTKGNIVVISDIVNRLKSDASLEDLKKIINFYIKK